MAALNRFISRLGERGLPFFKLLKHQEKFVRFPEADQALAQLNDFLSKPPILTAPHKGEQLLLYLAATTHVVSTAIVVERQEDGHAYPVQRPVYFVSEVLSESKARYQPVQKLLYALLITSRKLRRGDTLSPGRHGGLLDDLLHGLGGSSRSLRGPWCRLLHRHPCRDVTTFSFSTCQKEDGCISAYDYSSKSLIASRRVLTFDYAGLRQRRLGSRRLGHRLGSGRGLLGGRRDFFRHR
jgi:hypothetical protein